MISIPYFQLQQQDIIVEGEKRASAKIIPGWVFYTGRE